MNTNTIAEYTTCRHRGTNVSGNILAAKKTKQIKDGGLKAIKMMKWLLRPESENDYPLFESRLANIWANITKSLFWVGVAIAVGFIIAQLSS
jgi:hypothetical protein